MSLTSVPRLRIAAGRQVTQLMGLASTPWCGIVVQGSWEFERSLAKDSLPLKGYLPSTISVRPGSISRGLVEKKKNQHHSSACLSLSWACRITEEEVGDMSGLPGPQGLNLYIAKPVNFSFLLRSL